MRIFGRNDFVLAGGLTIALVVLFSRPVAHLLDFAREIDQTRDVQLLPALTILATVFVFHQLWKRHEVRAEAAASAAIARDATQRAHEMTRLVAFGQALGRSLEQESIRLAAAAHLPLLAPGRGVWAMTRHGAQWDHLVGVGDTSPAEREQAARKALEEAGPSGAAIGDICFPMVAGGKPLGVLGVSAVPPPTDHERSILAAAAALLAVSLQNAQLFREVKDHSVRDALTGCFNRRHALEVMDAELRRARRSKMPISLVMFDLDHFKTINDTHGHLCGDAVLALVGARMKAVLRGSDLKCRYGGEEFLILLPDTPLAGACHVADTLRQDIADHPAVWNDTRIQITASFGVTTITAGEVDTHLIMARADGALYRAKQDGRNCVRVAEDTAAVA
jgi:diguanylate cyclase (GGDEF)-like protein